MDVPWEYACWRATRYARGAVKPWEWEASELAREWMEYGLLSEAVENEIEAEESAKRNPKQPKPRGEVYHHAEFNH